MRRGCAVGAPGRACETLPGSGSSAAGRRSPRHRVVAVFRQVDDAPLVRGDYHYDESGPRLGERVIEKLQLRDEAGVVVAQAQGE